MAKKKTLISASIDNYHDKYQIFIYFKFKGRILLLSRVTLYCQNMTKTCQIGEHFTNAFTKLEYSKHL